MKRVAIVEKGQDGTYSAYFIGKGAIVVGDGATVAEAKTDFIKGFNELLSYFAETGEEIPKELQNVEWEYKYDIASVFNYFDFINVTKFAKRAGINASLLRQYKTRDTYISEAQMAKIQNALQAAGREMAEAIL